MITFSTWDLAGQSVYYAAHQMFLSPNTLYLAVWNVTHGEEGVESLRRWLLNIQVCTLPLPSFRFITYFITNASV